MADYGSIIREVTISHSTAHNGADRIPGNLRDGALVVSAKKKTLFFHVAVALILCYVIASFSLWSGDDSTTSMFFFPSRDNILIRQSIYRARYSIAQLNKLMPLSLDEVATKIVPVDITVGSGADAVQAETISIKGKKKTAKISSFMPKNGCEATVQIIRHCEKDEFSSIHHCNYQGFERAQFLQSLYGDRTTNARWPIPSKIYALSGRREKIRGHHVKWKKMVYREVETVLPLALKYNITIRDKFGISSEDDLSKEIFVMLQKGEMCGKLILICWKHTDIPKLAQHLGCSYVHGCPYDYQHDQFDQVWQIKYVYYNDHHINEELPSPFLLSESKSNVKEVTNDQASSNSENPTPISGLWKVFGSVQHERFDPLEFSSHSGDYPNGGTSYGGRWAKDMVSVEEYLKDRNHKKS